MSSVFVPYLERPDTPRSSDLTVLRTELHRCRAIYGRRSEEAAQAFNRLAAAAAANGRPLDTLDIFIADEAQRFMSKTVAGADGHVYWNGPASFTTNGGRSVVPHRWWWQQATGQTLGVANTTESTCGEAHCINPKHREARTLRPRRFTDEQMLGTLQVVAQRLGHVPTGLEWDTLHNTPHSKSYRSRFGSFHQALRHAGLEPQAISGTNPEQCRRALRFAAEYLGHPPTSFEFRYRLDLREKIGEAGLPTMAGTITNHLGSWPDAIKDTFG